MKFNTHLISVGLLFGFFFILFNQWSDSSFNDLNAPFGDYSPKAIGDINTKFGKDLEAFVKETKTFNHTVEDFSNSKISNKKLLKEYSNLRLRFKSVEFILEYLDKEAYDKILNGAPLPKLEKKVADLTVLEPHGLQVIDEIIASENINEKKDIETLLKEVQLFEANVEKFYDYLKARRISDRQFFEASRQAVIRLTTLGITGFDTPGTLKGIEDTNVVLKTLKSYLELYQPELENIDNIELLNNANAIFNEGVKQTSNINFDQFNRLSFIKEIVNPTYKIIKDIHLALDYETIDEVSRFPQAVNYGSENLFESNFLNNFYYVSLEEDSTYKSKADLGKLLFYDPILSQNNAMSCATCHNPDKGFTDGERLSKSNNGTHLDRNAMTLNYSVYATAFFHDLRAKRLEDQFEHVVLSSDEFNSSYQEILEKINSSSTYVELFKKAFPGRDKIIFNDLDYVLAAYVMQLNTFDSAIDQYFTGKINSLPPNVERGFNLFTGKAACATCHFTPLFSGNVPPLYIDSEAEILGVPEHKEEPWILDSDIGRLDNGVTMDIANFYQAAFKTPTVRNIALTAPYMHNGVFDTLEEVMDFYNKGGGAGNGMDLEHQTLASDPLDLTDQEIKDIISFMEALNDTRVFERPKELPRDFKNENLNNRIF